MSSQTLEKRGFNWEYPYPLMGETGFRPDPDLVIVDEAHEVRRKVLKWVMERGIFTTADRHPVHPGLGKLYEKAVTVTNTNELIRDGWLVPCMCIAEQAVVE